MAGWRSRHFTAVTALGPQEVELEHSKVVVSWLLWFHVLFKIPPIFFSPRQRHKHKEFRQKPPPPRPLFKGAPDPCKKFFMFRPPFPSKHRKNPNKKNFGGGGLKGPKILYAEILHVFYLLLISDAGKESQVVTLVALKRCDS